MKAAILAVGSELLGTTRLDTNSLTLAGVLERHGVTLGFKAVVGDDEAALATEIARLLDRFDLLLVTGGLGPTADDVTREALARSLGRELRQDPEAVAELEAKFASYGMRMPENNRRQAFVVEGGVRLANDRGSAPGQRVEVEERGATVFLLPGPPHELAGMIERDLEPWLAERDGGTGRETRTLKVASVGESALEERIAPAYEELGREAITVLASPGEVRVLASASGGEAERRRRLDAMEERLLELIGREAVFARSDEETLEGVIGRLLARSETTVATAESCTGGLVAGRITAVAGSSEWFPGAIVTYSDEAKTCWLEVESELLESHGAVSEPVARAMASGVRRVFGTDWGIGVTGIAGPGGGSEDKPVGTVHLAVAGPDENGAEAVSHRRVRFPGDRDGVRRRTVYLALELLRRRLLALGPAGVWE